MNICRSLFLALMSLLCLCASLPAQTLRLSAVLGGVEVPIVGASKAGGLLVGESGAEREVPEKTEWRLRGDVRENAVRFKWNPRYSLFRVPDPDALAPERPHRARAFIMDIEESQAAQNRYGPNLREIWPGADLARAVVVGAWIVGGEITQILVIAAPNQSGRELRFELREQEAAGQMALLLWADGQFLSPTQAAGSALTPQQFAAAMLDDWEGLKPAVEQGAKLGALSFEGGMTLLEAAAKAGALRVVQALLSQAEKNWSGAGSLLHEAAGTGRMEMVTALLKAGVKKDAQDGEGATALFRAAQYGHTPIVRLLLERGANVDVQTSRNLSAVSEALNRGYADIVELLYPLGKFRVRDDPATRAVLRAQATSGHLSTVKWLLDKKISPNNVRDFSALANATRMGHREIMAALLEAKADPNWQDPNEGVSVLMHAVDKDFVEGAQMLLDAGADVVTRNRADWTALHVAAQQDAQKCMELLLNRGADFMARDTENNTALDVALTWQSKNVLPVLIAQGARIDLKASGAIYSIEGALALDDATIISRALEGGWKPDTPLAGDWPTIIAADVMGANACLEVLRAAAGNFEVSGPTALVARRDVQTQPAIVSAVAQKDPRSQYEKYPAQTVLVDALIDAKGRVLFPKIGQQIDRRIAMAILGAVVDWKFSPAVRDGVPVAVRVTIPVNMASSEGLRPWEMSFPKKSD